MSLFGIVILLKVGQTGAYTPLFFYPLLSLVWITTMVIKSTLRNVFVVGLQFVP